MITLNLILNILVTISALQARTAHLSKTELEDDNEIQGSAVDQLEEQWFEQYLNHFEIQDNRTFFVRYFEEDKFFKAGGPLLIEIGGEGGIDAVTIPSGQSYQLAKKLHGKIVLLEHRYYGRSAPFENFTASDLIYLTVEQALEDLAYFVETFKSTRPGLQHSKVAVFGCSYSAALATWFRYKFPHLADAAWASSAPLRAVSDFYEYLEVASEVYSNVSSKCVDVIRKGYDQVKVLLSTPEGEQQVKSKLENWECGNTTEMSASDILGNIRYIVADHNVPPDHGVESCKILTNHRKGWTYLDRLVAFLRFKAPETCSDPFVEYPNDSVAWNYQTCTEFGFSITGTSRKHPFNDTWNAIDDDLASCRNLFGEGFDKELLKRGIDRINRVYGSVQLRATKVLSVHGSYDPWYRLGLYQETDEEAPVIFVPGTSHCADQNTDENEPLELTKAKSNARKIMTKWLQ